MDEVQGVQVMNSQANMNEDFPKEVVSKRLALLLLDSLAKIPMLTILHYDVDRLLRDK